MAVTHIPKGFTGTVNQIAEARRWSVAVPPFRTAGSTDWAVTADLGVARQADVAAGEAIAYGVEDTTTAPDAVAFAANNGSTNRFDAVVATFSWVDNPSIGLSATVVVFRVIQGTTSPPLVNATTTIDNTKINRIKGVQYDALLAIVRVRPGVGTLSSGDVVDCRMWGGFEGYANVPDASYLTMLDTQTGSLVHAANTDIVWNRLANGVWGFEKWIGSDKTQQPMMTVRNLTVSNAPSGGTVTPVYWANVIDHSQGLLSLTSDGTGNRYIKANVPGRVSVKSFVFSDTSVDGSMYVQLGYPNGGGDYITALPDMRERATGYPGSGTLRQTLGGTLQVQPGDLFDTTYVQFNISGLTLSVQFFMTVTYV